MLFNREEILDGAARQLVRGQPSGRSPASGSVIGVRLPPIVACPRASIRRIMVPPGLIAWDARPVLTLVLVLGRLFHYSSTSRPHTRSPAGNANPLSPSRRLCVRRHPTETSVYCHGPTSFFVGEIGTRIGTARPMTDQYQAG